jgi:hypothetical protein
MYLCRFTKFCFDEFLKYCNILNLLMGRQEPLESKCTIIYCYIWFNQWVTFNNLLLHPFTIRAVWVFDLPKMYLSLIVSVVIYLESTEKSQILRPSILLDKSTQHFEMFHHNMRYWWSKITRGSRKGLNSLIILVAWELWKHQNACVFEGARSSIEVLLQSVANESNLWTMVYGESLGLTWVPC